MRDYFYIVVPLPPYYILIFLLKIEILARPSLAPHLKWGEMGQFLHGFLSVKEIKRFQSFEAIRSRKYWKQKNC